MSESELSNKTKDPPIIQAEEDIPFDISRISANTQETIMQDQERKTLEALMNIKTKMYQFKLKDRAFGLIIFFSIILILLYSTDVFLLNHGWKNSSLLTGIFELLKLIISTLLGYIFAQKTNHEQ